MAGVRAFGHLLPYLELAEWLALRGHRVSFVSTPGNIARLPALRPAARRPRGAPLPRIDGLPDGADRESTNSVPRDKFELLFKAFDGLAAPFAEFLGASCTDEGKRPDWVIVDCFHYWAAAAAVNNKVPCAMLLLSAASLAAARDRQSSRAKPGAAAEERPAAAAPRYESEQKKQYFAKDSASGVRITYAQRVLVTWTADSNDTLCNADKGTQPPCSAPRAHTENVAARGRHVLVEHRYCTFEMAPQIDATAMRALQLYLTNLKP